MFKYVVSLTILAISLWVLDVALWLTWFFRLIEVESIFSEWMPNLNPWLIFGLATLGSIAVKLVNLRTTLYIKRWHEKEIERKFEGWTPINDSSTRASEAEEKKQ